MVYVAPRGDSQKQKPEPEPENGGSGSGRRWPAYYGSTSVGCVGFPLNPVKTQNSPLLF